MTRFAPAFAAALALAPGLALAEGSEVMVIGSFSDDAATYYQLTFAQDLSAMGAEGLGVRLDLAHGSYDTFYDATDGTAETQRARLLLTYDIDVAAGATLTLNGGLSYYTREVRPVTANSPDDVADQGYFVSAELYWLDDFGNSLMAIAEHDSVAADYYSARYLFDLGGAAIGPTANYLVEGDYSRVAYGATVEVPFSQGEFSVTAATADAELGGGGSAEVNYVEMMVRFAF